MTERFFNSCLDCVEIIDLEGTIVWVNERRQRLLATSSAKLGSGSMWTALWAEPFRAAAAASLLSARTGGAGHFTGRAAVDSASSTWWDVRITLVEDGTRVAQLLSIARDMTSYVEACRDRERLLDREREARLALEKENRKRDYALLVAAHELGAPLYAVRGWAQYLQLGNLESDEVAEAVDAIGRNTEHQHQLVERLLEVARFRSRSTSLNLLPNLMEEILGAAIECVQPVASSKQIAIQSDIATSSYVLADFDQLQRAFSNLLFNSVKFTPSGGLIVVRCQENYDRVTVEFTDTGAGIEPEFLEKVFEPFSQGSASRQPFMVGLGLGLSIVRRIVEGHQGAIRVSSDGAGRGTSFIIDLPLPSLTIV